jgi:phage terminase large subunit-like protein
MCAFGADGIVRGRSPDLVDALVWALTDLMIERVGVPRVRMV